jgi:hypothetical protein
VRDVGLFERRDDLRFTASRARAHQEHTLMHSLRGDKSDCAARLPGREPRA